MQTEKLPLTAHLEELRRCLVISFMAIGIGFLFSYAFAQEIFDLLARPLYRLLPPRDVLIFTGYPEAFFLYLKLAFLAGVVEASPVILYQVWRFIEPGLYEHEKKMAIPFVLASTFFFVCGLLFAYFVVFPVAFKFFLGYNSEYLSAVPTIGEYFSFATRLLLAFGLVFEFPVVMCFLARMHVVTVSFLRRNRKYAILGIFILAALLTPTPDVVNQLLMAGPLLLLYELSILLIWLMERKSGFAKE
ncbi:MAG: twin-arginine translocase subunit TatC [Thermodesulfobacteriota bacterium]